MIIAACVPKNELASGWCRWMLLDAGGGGIILWLLGSVQCDQSVPSFTSFYHGNFNHPIFPMKLKNGISSFSLIWLSWKSLAPVSWFADSKSFLCVNCGLPPSPSVTWTARPCSERDSKLTHGLWTLILVSVCLKLLPHFVFLKFPVI